MSINASDFRQFVIQPALAVLEPAGISVTKTAADLLMATAAVETGVGTWLSQINGPALGVFQIEPASLQSVLAKTNGLQYTELSKIKTPQSVESQLDTNLLLAAAICRLFYWQIPELLPPATISGLWRYYKTYYNTAAGATTEPQFISALKLTDLGGLPT